MNDLLIYKDRRLSEFCTFKIGGLARAFVEVATAESMKKALKFAQDERLPYLILGKGSNCLFDDRGFDGLVILNKIDFIQQPEPGRFHVGAGYSFSRLGGLTARKGWAGLEFASGIPGTVGGAVFMNAGANGSETCDVLAFVDFMHPEGRIESFSRDSLTFSYRTSPFQRMPGAIVAASFALTSCQAARDKQLGIVKYRQKTQPYGEPSAGCVFRNPASQLSAGALIDRAGLKGLQVGGAAVSSLHANFIVNQGSATAKDVINLIAILRERVQAETGVELIQEVVHIPFEGFSHE